MQLSNMSNCISFFQIFPKERDSQSWMLPSKKLIQPKVNLLFLFYGSSAVCHCWVWITRGSFSHRLLPVHSNSAHFINHKSNSLSRSYNRCKARKTEKAYNVLFNPETKILLECLLQKQIFIP